MTDAKPQRVLPEITPENEHFWRGGADGELRFLRCAACSHYVHPPAPVCPACLGRALAPEAVSGRATLLSYTVNHHPWMPGFAPPYVIAIVEIDEQPGLRLTTNLVGCAEREIAIGMPLRVKFEAGADGVFFPLFEPDARAPAPRRAHAAAPQRAAKLAAPARGASPRGERSAVITGIGQSDVGRRLSRDPLALTVDACLAAIADAGLTRADIDGVATYPGMTSGAGFAGFSGAGVSEVQEALRLELDWYHGGSETSGQLGSVITACAAIAAGYASHVLCFRTVWESTAQGGGRRQGIGGRGESFRAGGFMQWVLPFGAASAANWIALFAQRHMHEFGTTREQLAQIALNARKNAAHNPRAVYREPLSMSDYLSARLISTPFCLYDCDVPVDGSTAFVISRADRARDLRRPALHVEAVGAALHGRPSWDQFDDLTTMALRDAGKQLWTRTDFTPRDVHVAELYDGFSFITLAWLEALGFCGRGESGAFVEGGARIALGGELPLNTNGGQLSGGRLHGYGYLHEACVQLRGEGGTRQVQGARVAVAAAGGGPIGGCLLIRRD
ncbi:MAG TPA: OB-fold domain-containing protein [Myxococcota bacterium]